MAVVIHARAVVGNNCMIGTSATIGEKSGWYEVPIIGNNVAYQQRSKNNRSGEDREQCHNRCKCSGGLRMYQKLHRGSGSCKNHKGEH